MPYLLAPFTMFVVWLMATLLWWALAFMPTSGPTPEWLAAARNVCFGTLENGLPDTYGWMLLTLGPASFLVGLAITWNRELVQTFKTLMRVKMGLVFVVLMLLAVLLESHWVY